MVQLLRLQKSLKNKRIPKWEILRNKIESKFIKENYFKTTLHYEHNKTYFFHQ